MDRIHTDILIVGAGPAGSSAALSACKKGANVLMVEQKKTIGLPVQCAEFIPARLIGDMGLNKSIRVQKIKGMQTFIEGRLESQIHAPGYIINRDKLDQHLAKQAEICGCKILTSTRAIGLVDENTVLLQNRDRQSIKVVANAIIAADGPQSVFRKWLETPRQRLLAGVQMNFALKQKTDFTKVYFAPDIFGGYGWVFPKNHRANVGLGFCYQQTNSQRATVLLTSLVQKLKEAGVISGKPLGHSAGWIPVEPLPKVVFGNIVFVGDSAGQTHPITGAGIFSALTCGKMAGSWAASAVQENNPLLLQEYDTEWRDLFGRSLFHASSKRKWMEAEWHRFDQIIKSCWVAFSEYYAYT